MSLRLTGEIMLIKHQSPDFPINQATACFYVLIGNEAFLLDRTAAVLKQVFKQQHETSDHKIIDLDSANQWLLLQDEVNSYSLFSQATIIDARLDKKSLDAQGKAFVQHYLDQINSECLLIIRAPYLTQKQLPAALINHPQAVVIQIKAPDRKTILNWISKQLTAQGIRYASEVPALIEQYTRGNLLAAAQTIEKIALTHNRNQELSLTEVQQQLVHQSDYTLYELSDVCHQGDSAQALLILRRLLDTKVEPTLILWLLAQEIRYLHQLISLTSQQINFQTAIAQLKIWPQRAKLYQDSLKRHSLSSLNQLVKHCQRLDNAIKTGQHDHLPRAFERLTFALTSGTACLI